MTIDILCKVVDNFGDIGVVFRLAKALSDLDPTLKLRLVVDDLVSFHALEPGIDPNLDVQELRGWTVVRWDKPWGGFLAERPRFIIESFACGRPDWLEEIIFDPGDSARKLIVNLEYLSAEDYATDFHRLPSATRSALVKKSFFMPGFGAETGGLIIDQRFREARERFLDPELRDRARRQAISAAGLSLAPGEGERFWVAIFSYERDYKRIVADLSAFNRERPLLALVASGRSEACFLRAWENAKKPFPILHIPFLPQETWDDILLAADFAIVRGEETLARACLSGRPFLWQAYVQEDAHQLVKVRALLDHLGPHFPAGCFALVEDLFIAFNDRLHDSPTTRSEERLLPFLERGTELEPGFAAFSRELYGHGDLASHLLTFLLDFV